MRMLVVSACWCCITLAGLAGCRGGPPPAVDTKRIGQPEAAGGGPVFLNPRALKEIKRSLVSGDAAASAWLTDLRRTADTMLEQPHVAVTDKTRLAASGDPHDYVSLSIYWWPNPLTGKPYLHWDGQRNPEASEYDAPRLGEMARRVRVMALAGAMTGERAYADAAAEQLRVWFLRPTTRMNPNLDHAQHIPGLTRGGRQGVIEGVPIARDVLDAAWLVGRAGAWSDADRDALDRWARDFLDWLLNSPLGRAERGRSNNHGTWYDLQVASLAAYLGDRRLVDETLERARRRLLRQVRPDGRQPQELSRTKSFDYSVYNLDAWFRLASLADRHGGGGVKLWHVPGGEPPRLARALEYLVEHAVRADWPHDQIVPLREEALYPLLLQASRVYGRHPNLQPTGFKPPENAEAVEIQTRLRR